MGQLGELFVAVRGETDPFDKAIDNSEKKAKAAQVKLQGIADKLSKTGRQLTTFVSLPIIAIGAAFTKAASDAEETNSKFDAVFKDQKESVRTWAKEFSDSVNRATIDNIGFLSTIQDTLVPLGFARDAASAMSKQVVTLATDMASFNNLPTRTVIQDIQSAIVGNVETVRKYGVVLNEAVLKQEAYNLGLSDGKEQLDAQTKAAAAMSVIMKSTTDAQGDAIRTADSFANQLKGLQATATDLAEIWGTLLIPTAKKLVETLKGIAEWVRDLDESKKKLVIRVAALAAAIGPAIFIVSKLITAFIALKGVIIAVSAALAVSPYGALILGIAAVTGGLAALVIAMSKQTDEAAKSARWHETLNDGMLTYKDSVDDATSAIQALSQAQIDAREIEIGLALRKLKSDQELLGQTIERNQKIIALEMELSELKKWRFINEVEQTEVLTKDQKIYLQAVRDVQEGIRQVNEKVKIFGDEIDGVAEKKKVLTGVIEDLIEDGFTAEGDAIQALLDQFGSLMETTTDIVAGIDKMMEEMEEKRQKREKKEEEDREKKLADMKAMATYISGPFVDAYSTAFSALGQSLVEGGNAFNTFREAFKETIAGMLDMLAKWLVSQAILHVLPPPNPAAFALSLLGAAAARTAAGAVRALSEGGDFIVPPGYPNDSYPMRVESGERVQVTSAKETRRERTPQPVGMQGDVFLDGAKVGRWMEKQIGNQQILLSKG